MKLLLAEDEKAMSDAVKAVLTHFGYDVDAVYDGTAALEKAESGLYDCMIFDIMMPRMSGLEALSLLRKRGDMTPVILLTAKAEVDDRIGGLDAGADDYLTKPFAMGELLARIRSLTRRAASLGQKRFRLGHVELDADEQELSCQSSIRLGSKETRLMKLFMQNEGKALSTEEIFRHVWDDEPDVTDDIVWMYISFLREKLEAVHGDIFITGHKGGTFTLTTGSV